MLSLVVPTYNERHNLPTLLERLQSALADCGEPFEVIVVDDDSPDGTAAAARSLQPRFPWLRVRARKHQRDLSTAVLAGWFEGRGDILGVIDGDLQHPPELLPTLLRRLKETGADLVIASRHVRGGGVSRWSPLRRLISWGATLMAGFILPGTLSRVRDPMSGYFLVRRAIIEGAPLRPVGYKILLEVLAKGEYQEVEEIPYIFQERHRGGSKLSAPPRLAIPAAPDLDRPGHRRAAPRAFLRGRRFLRRDRKPGRTGSAGASGRSARFGRPARSDGTGHREQFCAERPLYLF